MVKNTGISRATYGVASRNGGFKQQLYVYIYIIHNKDCFRDMIWGEHTDRMGVNLWQSSMHLLEDENHLVR